MTTFPPIQPRPILCKTTTNNIQSTTLTSSSSPIYLIQSSTIPNTNPDINTNHISSQLTSIPPQTLSPSEEFLKRLRDFHRSRQTTFRCLPTIAGQVVDLHLLYNTVINHGGWEKVNHRQLWPTIAEQFSIDSTCLNGTQALKNIYIRYLYAFEKINNGETLDLHDDENEDSKRRTLSQLQRVPQSYNHAQHNVPDALRSQHGLFNDFVRRNEYEKLELALICGFPNELTFTLNTLLLLSSSSNHSKSFHLYKCPRLLDLLLRHIGLFYSSDTYLNDQSYEILYKDLWSKHLNYHLEQFWIESCSANIVKLLLNIENKSKDQQQETTFNMNFNEKYQEQLFRIEQILMIIRNLSFDRLNSLYLIDTIRSISSITYKFLLLISYCQKNIEFQKYAYDIWANLALYMHLRMISNDEGLLFRQLLTNMLNGDDDNDDEQQQDRFKLIRALDIISNLAQAGNDNGIYLIDYIHIIVKNLLHIPDILILVHTLECLYQLSELGEQLCDAILNVQSSTSIITTLIDLLTIEARSFSSQAIKTIKIVEMSSGPVLLPSYHQPPPSIPQQPVVVISTNQQSQQQQQAQHYLKPLTITGINPGTNLLSVQTSSPTIQINSMDKKRKHDSISETIAAVVNGTSSSTAVSSSPQKRARPAPPKKPSVISSIEDENSIENSSTNNNIPSGIKDPIDHSSLPSFDNDIRSCLNDLCERVEFIVDQSLTDIYNQIPSPVFKRKMDKQTDEQSTKKKPNHLTRKESLTDNNNINITTHTNEKKDETLEQVLSDVKPIVSTPVSAHNNSTSDYICEWENCRLAFPTARSVFHHVCSAHVKYLSDYICLWNGCDKIRRQKWALISHIQERHCSEVAFRQAKLKLTNPVPSTTTNAISIPINTPNITNRPLPSSNIGYAPDAAWLAIRRHMQINSFDDQYIKTKEGPLTKSIRLTAALILRNIARHSSIGKQNLRQYEQLIANIALESSEASHTLSSCLFELYN